MQIVKRQKNGALSIRLPHAEGLVLCTLPDRLRDLLASEPFTQRVVDRLFPRTYEDPAEEAEYRKLLGDDLRRRKLQALEVFERSLINWKLRPSGVELKLGVDEIDPWIGFVNDIRILLGIELDIEDNEWGRDFDPESCENEDLVLLHFLTWLEQEILDALGFANPSHVSSDGRGDDEFQGDASDAGGSPGGGGDEARARP
jgi:hypothetical protein